jgi:hypothetical protein
MFALLRFLNQTCGPFENNVENAAADEIEAESLMVEKMMPLLPRLLRSFDPATVDPATGNNALQQLCRLFCLKGGWHCDLLKQLIARGVSVHARNNKGQTPLLVVASTPIGDLEAEESSANGFRLLLQHGADLHAQDVDGNGFLHFLVKRRALGMIQDLLEGGQSVRSDFALLNAAGQTAAGLARQLAEQQPNDLAEIDLLETAEERNRRARQVHRVVAAHAWAWARHARPAPLQSGGRTARRRRPAGPGLRRRQQPTVRSRGAGAGGDG